MSKSHNEHRANENQKESDESWNKEAIINYLNSLFTREDIRAREKLIAALKFLKGKTNPEGNDTSAFFLLGRSQLEFRLAVVGHHYQLFASGSGPKLFEAGDLLDSVQEIA